MNSKQIIRALNALFQLDDEDRALVIKLWNLSDFDREEFVRVLQVQPSKPTTKKTSKKSTSKGASKSPRASSLQAQIQGRASNGNKPQLCAYEIDGNVCRGTENDGIHDSTMGYRNYHEFVAPAVQAATAEGE